MRAIYLAALAAGLTMAGAGAAAAQAQPTPAPGGEVGLPLVAGAEFDESCGPRPQYQSRAICVRASLAAMEPVAATYVSHFQTLGWQVVGGEENGVVFARRRPDGGGCDGLEMVAFYDETRPIAPASQAWLAFAPIPGDVCAGAAAQ